MSQKARSLFGRPTKEDYLKGALGAEKWIKSVSVHKDGYIQWPQMPEEHFNEGEEVFGEDSLDRGNASIILYYVQLYEALREEKYLDEIKVGAQYYLDHWTPGTEKDLFINTPGSQWSFLYGAAGIAYLFIRIYELTNEDIYLDFAKSVTDKIYQAAVKTDNGVAWSYSTSPYFDGSLVLFFLKLGQLWNRDDYTEIGKLAADQILTKAIIHEDGSYEWQGLDPANMGDGVAGMGGGGLQATTTFPNYEAGTAGVSFILATAYELTGDKRYLDAAEAGIRYLETIVYYDAEFNAALIPYRLPDYKDLFYLGFCNGPVGSSRAFYQLYKVTKNEKYKEWLIRLANGIEATGAPEFESPGYWNNDSICCGTAGIGKMYISLYQSFKDEKYLDLAIRCGIKILSKAHVSEEGYYSWAQVFTRLEPWNLTKFTTYFPGAAGIGSFLLELFLVLEGKTAEKSFVFNPFPRFF